MQTEFVRHLQTPIGRIALVAEGNALVKLRFFADGDQMDAVPVLLQAEQELMEYFAGRRRQFSVPLCIRGTEFQKRVWQALLEIPYGDTANYARIAGKIGNPAACRAVGMANNRNPLPIFLPCHRVIGKDGSLTGYAAGLEAKKFLLELEGKHVEV